MPVDTGHNFAEVLEFGDRRAAELGARLIVASVQESIDAGKVTEELAALRAATGCRRRHCSTRSPTTASTRRSAVPGGRGKGPRARLDNSHDAELRKLLRVDLLILDFCLQPMDAADTADIYDYAEQGIMPTRSLAGGV